MMERGHNVQRDCSPWRYALVLTLSLRVIYSLIAVIFALTQSPNWERIHSNALTRNLSLPDHSWYYLLLGVWERFDTLWYLHIAERGYQNPASVVFFPLYPVLIKALTFLIFSPVAAALIISTAAAFFVFGGLQELWSEDHRHVFTRQSVLICSLWPGSFALFVGYADSLVFALIVCSLVQARKQHWILAAALGVGAALTKAVGVVVVVPLLIMAMRQKKWACWTVLLVPLGPAGFWGYLHRAGALTFTAAYAEYWRTVVAPPWVTLGWAIAHLSPGTVSGLLVFNLGSLIAMAILTAMSRERIEYLIYSAAVIVIVLCKKTPLPPLASMMRYLLIIFPAYAGLARLLEHSWLQKRFLMVGAVLFALNTTLLWLFLDWSLVV